MKANKFLLFLFFYSTFFYNSFTQWDYNTNYNELQLIQEFTKDYSPTGRNGSKLGEEVTGIGDVNGDGYNDWAIGLNLAADTSTSVKVGKVYIYYGGNSIIDEQDPALILMGENRNNFGECISGAGDVNNDGFDDVIVGEYGIGKAYLYYGGSPMNASADVIFQLDYYNWYYGYSVSTAGDVNNDGIDDIIISGYNYYDDNSAYIYLGGDGSIDNIADVVLPNTIDLGHYSKTVANAGDLNNDGFDDVIVAGKPTGPGRAVIFMGGNPMDTIPDLVIKGDSLSDYHFGEVLSSAGDFNGDGYDDIVAGVPVNDDYSYSGKVFIYYGGSNMDSIADFTIKGYNVGELGFSVSAAGDVNSDGYDDIIIGEKRKNNAYILFGSENPDSIFDITIVDSNYYSSLGYCVSKLGDVNNDGYDDVIVGAPESNFNGTNSGKVCIYYGSENMDSIADINFTGETAEDYFGSVIASAGDVNNDGFDDLLIGLPNDDSLGYNAGVVYFYYGGITKKDKPDLIFTDKNPDANDYYGYSVSGAGDVNNDGFDDIVISAPVNQSGRAYLYYGSVSMDTTADLVFMSSDDEYEFGESVSCAGDVNNDGYDDIIIGAPSMYDSGMVHIYFGGVTMDNAADVTIYGKTKSHIGTAVSSIGDINNDGFDDVIFADVRANNYTGEVFVLFGGSTMDNMPDLSFSGRESYQHFGLSVSYAGDLNGDNYDDFVIGSERTDSAYIFFGSENVDSIADLVLTGEGTNEYFGTSVSCAGDINSDGYDDVIIGASNKLGHGGAYIYLGDSIMDNVPDVLNTGSVFNKFGKYVSSAGDYNNDGYDDVIIGEPNNSDIGYYMGKAFLFMGDLIPPNAPLNFNAEGEPSLVNLSWSKNPEKNLLYYKIFRNTMNNFQTADSIDKVLYPDTNYFDYNIINGIKYYYWLTAINADGESPVCFGDSARPNTAPVWSLPDTIYFKEGDTIFFDLDSLVEDISDLDSTLSFEVPCYSCNLNTTINDTSHIITIHSNDIEYYGNTSLIFIAEDFEGLYDRDTVYFIVDNINDPPVVKNLQDIEATEDYNKHYLLSSYDLYDVDNDYTELEITAYAIGSDNMQIDHDTSSRYIDFICSPDSFGIYNVVITVTDPYLASDSDTIVLTVNPINDAPRRYNAYRDTLYFNEDPETVPLPIAYLYNEFYDVDDDSLEFDFEQLYKEDTLFYIHGDTLYMTPEPNFYGVLYVDVMAIDSSSFTTTKKFIIYLKSVNDKPVLENTIPDITFNEDEHLSYYLIKNLSAYFSDVEEYSKDLIYTVEYDSGGISLLLGDYYLQVSTAKDSFGIYPVYITATDDSGASASGTFNINVLNVNDPPKILHNLGHFDHFEDEGLVYTSALDTLFYDYDSEEIYYNARVFYDDTGLIVEIIHDTLRIYTVPNVNGTFSIDLKASDGQDTTTEYFNIIIEPINDPPSFINFFSDTSFYEDIELEIPYTEIYQYIKDADKNYDEMDFEISGDILTVIKSDHSFTFSASENWFGSDTLKLVVNDGEFNDSISFIANVISVNDAPSQTRIIYPKSIYDYSKEILFEWTSSTDIEGDPIEYILYINNFESDTTISGLIDTFFVFNGNYFFKNNYMYNCYVESTDGIDTVESSFKVGFKIAGDIDNIQDLNHLSYYIQNYPNPFSQYTTFEYNLPYTANVKLTVYDITGQEVTTIVDNEMPLGLHQISWNGNDYEGNAIENGIYIYRVNITGLKGDALYQTEKRMVYIK
ncbi:FG-GAP-like repeat-containing protein [Bacteroidota bacterium]